jgi:hypothetical protein
MPLTKRSRYNKSRVYEAPGKDGVNHPTIGIRRHEPIPEGVHMRDYTVTGVDTMETIAAKIYGSSAQWWRIADAGPVKFPLDLVSGSQIKLPSPAEIGKVERSRNLP